MSAATAEVIERDRAEGIDVDREREEHGLPVPVGWKILVRPISIDKVSKGGIMLPEETQRAKGYLRYIGQVVAMGSLCYSHGKFEGDVWCKVGDWILFGAYEGLVVKLRRPSHPAADDSGVLELRVINDDKVQAVLPDGYERDAIIYCD